MRAAFEKLIKVAGESFRCFRRTEPFFAFEWHYHPEVELTWIESDRGERIVGDHVSEYGPGDLVLVGSNLPHTWASRRSGSSGDGEMARAVGVQFDPDAALFQAPEMGRIRTLLAASSRGLWFDEKACSDVIQKLALLPDVQGPNRLIGLLETLATLAAHADRARPLASPAYGSGQNDAARQRIERTCGYIRDHLMDRLSQASLAKRAGMNASAFGRFFKKATGRTVVDYINDVRVGHACRLLIETDDSILEISSKSGFNNLSHFNRQFRRLRGSTPSGFRNHFSASAISGLAATAERRVSAGAR